VPGATKLRYQWLRSGKKIKRATKRVYRLTRKDRGKRIAVRMTYVLGGQTIKVTSKAIKVPRTLRR
jgi:hypothetical protein